MRINIECFGKNMELNILYSSPMSSVFIYEVRKLTKKILKWEKEKKTLTSIYVCYPQRYRADYFVEEYKAGRELRNGCQKKRQKTRLTRAQQSRVEVDLSGLTSDLRRMPTAYNALHCNYNKGYLGISRLRPFSHSRY